MSTARPSADAAQPTAGAWVAKRTQFSSKNVFVIEAGDGNVIASVHFVGNSRTEKANANLFAASKLLLEALKGVVDAFDIGPRGMLGFERDALKAARAAIDAATGSA